jgi:antitoxin HicB
LARSRSLRCRRAQVEETQERIVSTKPRRKATNPHLGSNFDDFLREEGLYDEAQAIAVKRVLPCELERGMAKAQLTKTATAKRMGTTRPQLDRLLNPDNPATTLQMLVRAAGAVGKRVKISLVNARKRCG